jgi:hypothetical protein
VITLVCNLSTQEAEAGELRVQGQPGLPSEILPLKKLKKKKKKKKNCRYNPWRAWPCKFTIFYFL